MSQVTYCKFILEWFKSKFQEIQRFLIFFNIKFGLSPAYFSSSDTHFRDGKSLQNSTRKTLSLKNSTQNMCKKCSKLCKNNNNCTTKANNFKKIAWQNQKLAHTARPLRPPFSISDAFVALLSPGNLKAPKVWAVKKRNKLVLQHYWLIFCADPFFS